MGDAPTVASGLGVEADSVCEAVGGAVIGGRVAVMKDGEVGVGVCTLIEIQDVSSAVTSKKTNFVRWRSDAFLMQVPSLSLNPVRAKMWRYP